MNKFDWEEAGIGFVGGIMILLCFVAFYVIGG